MIEFMALIGFAAVFVMMSLGYSQRGSHKDVQIKLEGLKRNLGIYENKLKDRSPSYQAKDIESLDKIGKIMIQYKKHLEAKKAELDDIKKRTDDGEKEEISELERRYEEAIEGVEKHIKDIINPMLEYQKDHDKKLI